MKRYESLADVSPHEENLLIFSETEIYNGEHLTTLVSKIKKRIRGEELTVQEHYDGLDRLQDFETLLPNSVWLIHHNCIIGDGSDDDLCETLQKPLVPKATAIMCFIDDECCQASIADTIDEEFDNIEAIKSKTELIGTVSMYLNTANPYIGRAGKQYIKTWNNLVCDHLENYG